MTNFEKIKNMSVEKFAKEIERISNYLCDCFDDCSECPFSFVGDFGCYKNCFLCWLNSEVEE